MADRRRKLERIRRATEAHRPTLAVTLVGSSVEMTPAVAAVVMELLALGRGARGQA